jgi:uncharacterized protein YndB with AHSA1/START domain
MTKEPAGVWTSTSKIIRARPDDVYNTFVDPDALAARLPPAEMTGKIHEFDARVGGGYRMSLFYSPTERVFRGKTSERKDMVKVRFVELTPPDRIVETISFVTTDPALFAEMTMTAAFEEISDGTQVTLLFENLPPPGLGAEDNETGAQLSLEQLATSNEIRRAGETQCRWWPVRDQTLNHMNVTRRV